MRKNPSPISVAAIAAIFNALISGFLFGLYIGVSWHLMVVIIAVFAVSFGVFYYLLQVFIHRKIKLIYKNIYRFKAQDQKVNKMFSMSNNDAISDVSNEVITWMRDNQREINQLKEQENFRRDFLGNVSHELKTPIFNIQGYIHTLLDGALEDSEVNRKFLRKASKSTDRLAELVQELTSITQLQAGKVEMKIAKFDVVQLVQEVFEMVEDHAKEREIKLEIKRRNLKPVYVEADKKKIRQVFTNLLLNAIKYGITGGKVKCEFFDMDQNILIEITDDGEGIAEEHLPRLFERFYRIDRHRSREDGGSGLGLAIVKHIIEAHQQTINVRSTLGKGSTFGFTLKKA